MACFKRLAGKAKGMGTVDGCKDRQCTSLQQEQKSRQDLHANDRDSLYNSHNATKQTHVRELRKEMNGPLKNDD
ncbi:hypothetical protein GCM10007898_33800 [Dyella flagellata]|uniref:Uncharacterized protein n=1 Tax=Dyella flagellata TaxID=1867833 RepID=A0ABQ5XH36_9GAMM|nr:hypothetical protein GCM10007898_33800 [Dyella flagellata]